MLKMLLPGIEHWTFGPKGKSAPRRVRYATFLLIQMLTLGTQEIILQGNNLLIALHLIDTAAITSLANRI